MPLDHRTDIYSLGVVMYQLLTGQLPFQASNNYNIDLPDHQHRTDPDRSTLREQGPGSAGHDHRAGHETSDSDASATPTWEGICTGSGSALFAAAEGQGRQTADRMADCEKFDTACVILRLSLLIFPMSRSVEVAPLFLVGSAVSPSRP
jgi:serine/threonine protein kinase